MGYNIPAEQMREANALLACAMTWSETKEGHNWWGTVQDRLRAHADNASAGRPPSDGTLFSAPPMTGSTGQPYRGERTATELKRAADVIMNFASWNATSEGQFWHAVHAALKQHSKNAARHFEGPKAACPAPATVSISVGTPFMQTGHTGTRRGRLLLLDETSTAAKGEDKLSEPKAVARLS